MRWLLPTGIALLGLALLLVHGGIVWQMAQRVVIADRLHAHLTHIHEQFADLDQRQHADVHALTDDVLDLYAQLGAAFEQAAGGGEGPSTPQRRDRDGREPEPEAALRDMIGALSQQWQATPTSPGSTGGAAAGNLIELRRETQFTGWLIAYGIGGALIIILATALSVVGTVARSGNQQSRGAGGH